jgi:uncharacterized membrane protein
MRIKWVILALVAVVGVLAWPELPQQIPSHWNAEGAVDAYGSKWWIWLSPAIAVSMLVLFMVLPKIDPKKHNYKKFKNEYEWIQVALVSFFGYLFVLQLMAGLNDSYAENFVRLMIGGMGLMFILLGSPMRTLKQNFFVGIRTPWTLTNAKSWKKTHELGGKLFMAAGLLFIVDAVSNWQALWVNITALMVLVVFLFAYSYFAKNN